MELMITTAELIIKTAELSIKTAELILNIHSTARSLIAELLLIPRIKKYLNRGINVYSAVLIIIPWFY